ncbi:MAG: hypothetical protein KF900_06350 [Bacteroidetes bacterium]|nr:hypothetical protein [Bacteroidota bacterium]
MQGIYDGKSVKISGKNAPKKKYKVVVTFLEEVEPEDKDLRNFAAQTSSMDFWENSTEDIYQDYLIRKKK